MRVGSMTGCWPVMYSGGHVLSRLECQDKTKTPRHPGVRYKSLNGFTNLIDLERHIPDTPAITKFGQTPGRATPKSVQISIPAI